MKRFFTTLWQDDQGQSTTEYILILSVVVMIAMKFRSVLQDKLMGILDKVTGNLDKAVSTEN